MSRYSLTASLLLAGLGLAGAALRCGGTNLAGTGSNDKKETETEDEGGGENEKASKPVAVSGAFLTCDVAADAEAMDDATMYGCALKNTKSQKRISGVAGSPVVKGTDGDGKVVSFPARGGLTSGAWHLHYGVPKGFKGDAKIVAVTMTLDGKKVVANTGGKVSGDWSFETGHADTTDLVYTEDKEPLDEGGTGDTPAAPAAPSPASGDTPKKIYFFVTSVPYAVGSGDERFNNIGNADKHCQMRMDGKPLDGADWYAVLSKHDRPVNGVISMPLKHPIVSLAGREIWPAGADIYADNPTKEILKTEEDKEIGPTALVWTGTTKSGGVGAHCESWDTSDESKTATVGKPGPNNTWLESSTASCLADPVPKYHFYCVSAPR